MTDTGVKFKPNKWWLIGGGAAVGGVIYFRHKSAANASAAATTATTVDPNAGVDPSLYTDPNASDYGSYGYGGAVGVTPGSYGYTDPYATGTTATATVPTTNGMWAADAESQLVAGGYDPLTASSAIGKYLTGQALSPDQMNIVETALAFAGNPPTTVPAPHIAPSTPTTPTPTAPGQFGGTVDVLHPPKGTQYIEYPNYYGPKKGQIFQEWPDESSHKLTQTEWVLLGSPKPRIV